MVAHIWREGYVILCLTIQQLSTGLMLGFPAVLIPTLTGVIGNDSDVRSTREEASWIAAAYGLTGPIGFIIMPSLMQLYGRKFINIFWNLFPLAGSIIIAVAPNVPTLFVGRCIQGISFCGMFITGLMASEYSHPKRRGAFVVCKVTLIHLGAAICHGLVFVAHWRHIAWLSTVPPLFGILTTMTWPESPSWLAYKGRYDECIKSFEWLRGNDNETREEVRELIAAQRQLRKLDTESNSCTRCVNAFRSKAFWKPFVVALVLTTLFVSSGIHYLVAYIIEIMVQLTRDKSKAYYYTMGFDVLKVISMVISIATVRIFKRRTLVLLGGGLSCIVLALTCIFHYFNEKGLLNVTWLTPLLLILYICICNIGVVPILIVIKGEIFPLKYKGIITSMVGALSALGSMASVKLTANMLTSLNTHGTFGVYLIIMLACLVFLYFYLPETKDRSLQDIENEIIGLKLVIDDDGGSEMVTIVKER